MTTSDSRSSLAGAPGNTSGEKLGRSLGTWDLVAYGLAYIAPVAPLTTLGYVWLASAGSMAASYLLGAACMLLTAWSYVRMNRVRRDAGSVYAFAGQTLGPALGFLAGWMLLLDYLLIPALVHVMMAIGMEAVVPAVDRSLWLLVAAGLTLAVNLRGLRLSSRVNQVSVLFQLVFLAVFLGLCVHAWLTSRPALEGASPLFDPRGLELASVAAGAGLAMLGFLGFDAISTLAEETRDDDPGRIGRATLAVMGISSLLFVLSAWILGKLMPTVTVNDPATAIFDLAHTVLGPAWVIVVAIVLVVLVGFTNALPMQTGVARVLFAMARDGRLPAMLARVDPQRHVPYVALKLSAVGSLGVAFLMRRHPDLLASVVNFGALSAFGVLHLALLRYDRQSGEAWSLGRSLPPLLGLIVVGGVAASLPHMAQLAGGAWALLGAALWRWRLSPRLAASAPL